MALSAQEKADVIFQLGWPGLSIVEGTTDYNKSIVDNLNNTSTPIDGQVRSLLTAIANIDTKIRSAPGRLLAKKIGDIELRDGELQALRSEKRSLCRELSQLLSIPMLRSGGINIPVIV